MAGAAGCFVCRKHRERGPLLPGGPVGEDELVIVSHLTPAAPDRPSGPSTSGICSWNHAASRPAWPT